MQVFNPCDGNDFRTLFFPSVLDTGSKLTFLGFPRATRVEPTTSPNTKYGPRKFQLVLFQQGHYRLQLINFHAAFFNLPDWPGGANSCEPVGIVTKRDNTAARLLSHGSNAMGLGASCIIELRKEFVYVNRKRSITTSNLSSTSQRRQS